MLKSHLHDIEVSAGNCLHRVLLRLGVDAAPASSNGTTAIIRSVMRESGMLLNGFEAVNLFELAKSVTGKIAGDVAEVGTYRGGSAKLLAMAKRPEQHLHLFDTFEGLPELNECDSSGFRGGQYAASVESVAAYLKGFSNIHLHKGLFPATAGPVEDALFCLAHLDVDLHDSMAEGLKFFYPRMASGGAILCHDYDSSGPRRAISTFFASRPEVVIAQPAGQYCLIVKA